MIESVHLEVQDLHKRYPNGAAALRGVSLSVQPGRVFGLIGPNGAGKSTLLKCISAVMQSDGGRVLCNGTDVVGDATLAARWVGLMPDPLGVYSDVSAADYLEFFARLLSIPHESRGERIGKVVESLQLDAWLDHEVESLSAGWQRRLSLARILLAQNAVLLLDEPAAGLDLIARRELLQVIRSLAQRGHTVVVSSHIITELEEIADDYGILVAGRWQEIVPDRQFLRREDLASQATAARWWIVCRDVQRCIVCLREKQLVPHTVLDDRVLVSLAGEEQVGDLVQGLVNEKVGLVELKREEVTLQSLVLGALEGKM